MNDNELPAGFGPATKVLADMEGVPPPGLESDPELVEAIAAGIRAGRDAPGGDDLTSKLIFSMRGRLIDGWTRRDALLSLGITTIDRADYTIDPLAVDDDSELAQAMSYQLNRRNLPDAKRQRAAWAALLRDERKLSQAKIAKLMNVSQPAVSQWFSEYPEFARKAATNVVGLDGKSYSSPATKATAPTKQSAAKTAKPWTPPFKPALDDPACPQCSSYGDDPCVNDTGTELRRWHRERIAEVEDYRYVRGTLTLIPEAVSEDEALPECPVCGAAGHCTELGHEFEAHCHPQRLELWAHSLEQTAIEAQVDAIEMAQALRQEQPPQSETVPDDLLERLHIERRRLLDLVEAHHFTDAVVSDGAAVYNTAVAIRDLWDEIMTELEPCPMCGAVGPMPCTTPGGKRTKRHATRVAPLAQAAEAPEA